MDMTLELIAVPVSDVESAKAFYTERLGFAVDHDTQASPEHRLVQLTPPGSGCSIVVQTAMPGSDEQMAPGSLRGLQLVVADIRAAREELAARGLDVGEVRVYDDGGFRPARADDALDNVGFLFFGDPDGNRWAIQQISARRGPPS